MLLITGLILLKAIKLSESGKIFYMNFMENAINMGTLPYGRIYLVNPSQNNATVTVKTPLLTSGPAAVSVTVIIPAEDVYELKLPSEINLSGTAIENKGIIVTSDEEISVQGLNIHRVGAGAFQVLPVERLGRNHVAVTYADGTGPFSISVTAIANATKLGFHFTGQENIIFTYQHDYTNGETCNITLDQYQTFEAQFLKKNGGEFTGTLVTSDKPVFIQSGSKWSKVYGYLYSDHLAEPLIPLEHLGDLQQPTTHIVVPYAGRTTGDVIRIVAYTVSVSYILRKQTDVVVKSGVLAPFQFAEYDTMVSTDYIYITSNSSLQVVHFLKSVKPLEIHEKSDPAMALHLPQSLWSSDYVFGNMRGIFNTWYTIQLNLVIANGEEFGLEADGAPLVVSWTRVGNSGFSGTQYSIKGTGFHRIRHTSGIPFEAVFYGQNRAEAFAMTLYSMNASLNSSFANGISKRYETPTTLIPEGTTNIETKVANKAPFMAPTEVLTVDTDSVFDNYQTLTPNDIPAETSSRIISTPTTMVSAGTSSKAAFVASVTAKVPTDNYDQVSEYYQTLTSIDVSAGLSSKMFNLSQYVSGEEKSRTEMSTAAAEILQMEWMYWSECSVTCGFGTQYRIKLKAPSSKRIVAENNAETSTQFRKCILGGCGEDWLPWESWSRCSSSCNRGTQTRKRRCRMSNNGSTCESLDHTMCDERPCKDKYIRISSRTRLLQTGFGAFFSLPSFTEADRRFSACSLGGGVIFFLVVLALVLFILDCHTLHSDCKRCLSKQKRRSLRLK